MVVGRVESSRDGRVVWTRLDHARRGVFDSGVRLTFAVVAAVSLLATACGGGNEGDGGDAAAGEQPAATTTAETFRTVTTELEPTFDGGTRRVRCEGAVDISRKRARIVCEQLDEPGGYELIAVGATVYLKPGGSEFFQTLEGSAQTIDRSPFTLFGSLRAASPGPLAPVGTETIRGEPTERYAVSADCGQLGLDCTGTKSADVWVDRQGVVRRIATREGTTDHTAEFFDFGVPVEIEAPSPDLLVAAGQDPTPDCRFELDGGEPISVRLALDTLRGRGLDVWLRENCLGSTVSDITGWAEGSDGGGELKCSVLVEPQVGVSTTRVETFSAPRGSGTGPDLRLRLANLECSVYVGGSPRRTTVERLSSAFEELRKAINP